MRKDKATARHLRLSGKSYTEIHEILKVPRSTLSDWFGKEEWFMRIRERLAIAAQEVSTSRIIQLNKIRGDHLVRAYEQARSEARTEFMTLKYNPLFVAGLMLYWGEGDKVGKSAVRLTNTDPAMIKLFVFFLSRICNIPTRDIGLHLLVYPDLNERAVREHWAMKVGLPLENFIKSTLIHGKHPTKRLGLGICIAYVSSTYLKAKVREWMRLLPKELMKRGYYENI